MSQQRVQEAKRLGFDRIILPKSSLSQLKSITGIRLEGVSTVRDAMEVLG